MNAYLWLVKVNLKLAMRERIAIFFNYVFPLIFFFAFGQLMHAEQGGVITQIVTMVLVIGILGNGLFGGGIRAVQDREQNILRRFKVAPISPTPMLVASMITGWALFVPVVVVTLLLARLVYGMPLPDRWFSLLLLVSVGVIAFRAIGLIIASVANSAQESQIMVQLVYLPMLFLTGTTFSTTLLPSWAQVLSEFLPATYLVTSMEGILIRRESLLANAAAVAVLLVTTAVSTLLSGQLFRWEKEEKLRASAKLWLAAMILPSLLLGGWQLYSRDHVGKTQALYRDMLRSRTLLLRNARIVTGDGRVIPSGAVLVRGGKIAEIYEGAAPEAGSLKADAIEAAGKTVLPGLIDVHVHLAASGGFYERPRDQKPEKMFERELAAYLYSGITAVRSAGDPLDPLRKVRSLTATGERLGAELFACGPVFTAPGGDGGEFLRQLPEAARAPAARQLLRIPQSESEARRQVDDLKRQGVDCITTILESGRAPALVNRMDTNVFRAVVAEAHAQGLPVAAHTGDVRDIADAIAAGVDGIEHGSFRETIPDALFAEMARRHVAYDPTLSVVEAFADLAAGNPAPLDRSLVQQVGPPELLQGTRRALESPELRKHFAESSVSLATAQDNLRRAYKAGVMLVTGSGAGSPLVLHGPTVQREVELWVEAGLPPQAALQAATCNAARLLRVANRMGVIAKGRDADLLVVDGNPIEDISAIERISLVIFKGEHLDRSELL